MVGPAGAGDPPAPEITYRPRRWLLLIPLGVLVVWSLIAHQRVIAEAEHIPVTALAIWGVTFATVGGQVILSWLGRPYTCPEPPGLTVAVIIPCYNEDIPYAERVLASLRAQTRKADQIIVVDDGSTKVDYAAAGLPQAYPEAQWLWQPENRGKKHAQVAGWCQAATTDVICTIDSDSALERQALAEALRPFADDRVAGVACVEWAYNYSRPGRTVKGETAAYQQAQRELPRAARDRAAARARKAASIRGGVAIAHLLTRCIGTRSVAFQLFAMSSQSAARGNVLIAPGAFSLFRAEVLREGQDAYLNETFCGMPVVLGDDTMLTLMALMRGRVVQQPTAVAFPAYPETISHHLRQWTRWMRASTIRTIWRLRYLPIASYGWWYSMWQLGAFTAGIAITFYVPFAWPASERLLLAFAAGLIIWPLILASRLACLSRSDQGFWSIAAGVALMPVGALWYLLVLRWMRFYGIATIAHQGWVTRQKKIEVKMRDAAAG